jgi:anti-sigma regulatory factor (Ser/Thr protein kinase)
VVDAAEIGDRAPRPDPRVNAVAMVAAAAAAAAAYVAALSTSVLPARGFAVVLLTAAPVLAAVALPVFWCRAAAEGDAALRWFATGLAAGLPAMVLQLVSFPSVAPGGGVLSTSGTGSAGLYLTFHLALALGALAGVLRLGARWQPVGVVGSVLLALLLAIDAVPVPRLLNADGSYTGVFIVAEVSTAVLTALCLVAWLSRQGRAARPLHSAVALALSLATYDLVLNAVSARRFDPVWWSSLSMRFATYAVLAAVALGTVLRQLSRWEAYSETELRRREEQLRASLGRTQELLTSASRTAHALQRALLPSELVTAPEVSLAARHRTADGADEVWTTWYDTMPLPSGGIALVVGEVEGRDVGAAPLVGLVRGAVRSYALEGHPPSVVLNQANALLCAAGAARTVSLAYVEVYPNDRIVTVAVGGPPTVTVLGPDGTAAAPLRPRPGPSLGSAPDTRWQERTVLLDRAALLVLSTGELDTPRWGLVPSPRTAGPAERHRPDEVADLAAAAVPPGQALAVVVARVSAGHRPAVSRRLPVHRTSAGVARVWVSDLFAEWRRSGSLADTEATRDLADTAQLLLTELVSNAVRHSDVSIGLHVALDQERLRIEVSDSSHRMPVLRRAGGEDTAGRGLFLVETLSSGWGVELHDEGKTVWCELGLQGPAASAELDEEALLAAFGDPEDVGA